MTDVAAVSAVAEPVGVAHSSPADGSPDTGRESRAVNAALAPYTRPRVFRSLIDVLTSVVAYLGVSVAMYESLRVSYVLTLALSVVAAGFLVRTFVVFHDCTHGSFLPNKRANAALGTVLGLFTFSSFACWRHAHLVHHGTAGDLDRRGVGDLPTKTTDEYFALSARDRRMYRVFRHPLVMFGLGPFVALIIQPRIVPRSARPRIKRRVHATNLALVLMVAAICLLIGWQDFLLIEIPTVMLSGAAGIWLFFVQHQFDDVYWADADSWSFADAALRGSSYLKLPPPLQFFTGNIGLHHVHHLNARIPNYNLQRAHDENAVFRGVPVLSLREGLRAVRLKLYDTDTKRMVTFAEADAGVRGRRETTVADDTASTRCAPSAHSA
jgi:omega-6 fatty acid desaturase (delta-12 desaturase)